MLVRHLGVNYLIYAADQQFSSNQNTYKPTTSSWTYNYMVITTVNITNQESSAEIVAFVKGFEGTFLEIILIQ